MRLKCHILRKKLFENDHLKHRFNVGILSDANYKGEKNAYIMQSYVGSNHYKLVHFVIIFINTKKENDKAKTKNDEKK